MGGGSERKRLSAHRLIFSVVIWNQRKLHKDEVTQYFRNREFYEIR